MVFDILKKAIKSVFVLSFPDISVLFYIEVDSLNFVTSAVLS